MIKTLNRRHRRSTIFEVTKPIYNNYSNTTNDYHFNIRYKYITIKLFYLNDLHNENKNRTVG